MEEEKDKRSISKFILRTLVMLVALALVGFLYYLLITHTKFSIGCYIYLTTGYKCPGCGLTRMVKHMAVGEFGLAFQDNRLLFIIWPLIIVEIIYILWRNYNKKPIPRWNLICVYAYIGVSLMFAVVRNILGW